MKKVLTAILLTALCFAVNGQKLQRENLGDYWYTQLPSDLSLVNFETYSVNAEGENSDAYRRDEILKYLNMNGFQKVSGAADFNVLVEEYPIQYGQLETKSKTNTSKDKDGKEIKTTLYYYQRSYNYKYRMEVTNSNGEVIYNQSLEGEGLVHSGDHGSSKAASEGYNEQLKRMKSEIIKNQVSSLVSGANEKLCFVPKNIAIKCITVKPKKFEYPEFDAAFEKFAKGFQVVCENKANDNIEAAKPYLSEVISNMEKALAESDPENKKARIDEDVTAAAYYNIAQVYFLMQDYENAVIYVDKAADLRKNMTNDQQHNSARIRDMKKRADINAQL